MSLIKKVFLSLSILGTSYALAQELNFEDELFLSGCIKFVEEDKLYIEEDQIYPTPNGLFLLVNDGEDFLRIPALFSDNQGCYVHHSRHRLSEEKGVEVRNKCPSCGERYIVRCTNKDCPAYQKRKGK
jgi:hypothetical protein